MGFIFLSKESELGESAWSMRVASCGPWSPRNQQRCSCKSRSPGTDGGVGQKRLRWAKDSRVLHQRCPAAHRGGLRTRMTESERFLPDGKTDSSGAAGSGDGEGSGLRCF